MGPTNIAKKMINKLKVAIKIYNLSTKLKILELDIIVCTLNRFFFEPDAREDNDIPVVNSRLSAKDSVLLNAPLAGKAFNENFFIRIELVKKNGNVFAHKNSI